MFRSAITNNINQREFDTTKQNLQMLIDTHKPAERLRGNDDPVPIMIEKAGYPCEIHMVETEDGYILQIHRIPHGRDNSTVAQGKTRPVVFVQHGLEGDSSNWVISYDYPEKSLGYILADAGYDVWLGNFRGNTYSRAHRSLDPEELPYWLFSWDEMAKYDLPTMLNKALDTTGQTQLFYIGHSMGTTTVMAMSDIHPEMKEKIILANLLAPVAYVEHMRSPIALIAPFANILEDIFELLGIGEFFPSSRLMDFLAELVCDEDWFPAVCEDVIFLLAGFDKAQMNETLLDTIVHHSPAGTSARAVVHYAQEVNSGRFCYYDFGKHENIEKYGVHPPPSFNVENITIPIVTYWGDNDWLAEPVDVVRLTSQLPNLVASYEVPFPQWSHLDFCWAIDADTLLYSEILKNMEEIRRTVPEWNFD